MSDTPATPKQQNVLADFGYDPNVSIEKASEIIDAIVKNNWQRPTDEPPLVEQQNAGYAPAPAAAPVQAVAPLPYRTDKQAACLEKFGLNSDVTKKQASAELDKLAENNWQLPSAPAVAQAAPVAAQAAPIAASNGYGDLPSFGG